ncbi:MAG: BatD family protein [Gammaproteobacteria bacterium]
MRTTVLAVAMLCGLSPLPAWAALQAYVDRNPVAEDESFTLTLESDQDVDGSPDLSPLRRDFDVEGQGRSSNLTIINGSMSRKTQWQISLMPKHSGQVQIPPITVGSEQSQPLTVTVMPASQARAAPGNGDLFMNVSVKPHTAYVQQQIIYTVRLYRAVDLANGSSLSAPSLPGGDAVVEKLGKDKDYETVRNGMRYDVIERHYAIYPQKSGSFDIAPLVFDGAIVQSGGGGGIFAFNPFSQRTRHKRLRSQAEHIDVKPMPAAFHGSQWLPARNLQLDENWSPDPPKFTVGQAVTRTVAVMADGLTASQLPGMTGGAISGVKQYPDQPVLKDTKDSAGVTGLRTQKIAYIPTHAGSFTLPAIKIAWWNTATDKMEAASLPAHTFAVLPGAAGGSAPQSPPVPAVVPPAPAKAAPQAAVSAPSTSPAPPQPQSGAKPWPWLALLLGIGWAATLVIWWWRARRAPVTPAASPPTEQEASLRWLEKALQTACFADDAAGAKGVVLAWARRRWPEQPPISLTAVARACPHGLADALLELDRALYAQAESGWQGKELWRQFAANRGAKGKEAEERRGDTGLEPLYRS